MKYSSYPNVYPTFEQLFSETICDLDVSSFYFTMISLNTTALALALLTRGSLLAYYTYFVFFFFT
jgi:hypothetical protein